jgi:hypothetical protein
MNGHAASVACCRPPAGALLALRTDRKVSIPIDLERTQIIAAFQLATVPILLHWADKGDPVLPSAFEHDLASDVGTVHQLTLR